MNVKRAEKIIVQSDLGEGPISRAKRIALLSGGERKELINSNPKSDDAKTAAAIEVQRIWRGYRARCNLLDTVNKKISKTAVYSGSLHHTTRLEDDFSTEYEDQAPPSTDAIRQQYQIYLQEMEEQETPSSEILRFDQFCARYIQEWWRNQRQKQEKDREISVPHASVNVTRKSPSPPPPPQKRRGPLSEKQAATVIQRAWRKHIDVQVYRYYRDLINFKARGNPSLMLRCINPVEAKLLDAASGVHIKFRLAGERFPPNIYYKIFTHRPIQDMCANSPKDYTQPQTKIRMAKDQHNNFRNVPKEEDKGGWYQRIENNGWRLVSDRLILHLMADPVTWETSNKKYEFNHNKLQRKQDLEKRKKAKKIDWMKKMYKEGMLKAKADDPETVNLIEGAAAGMVATVDKLGPDALEDWEVDELLDWTTSLNFDDYLSNWKEVATSSFSEKQVDDRIRLFTGHLDPYEFSVSTAQSRYQSTQASRNTPTSSLSGQIPVMNN